MTAQETELRMRKIRTRLSSLYSLEQVLSERGLHIVTIDQLEDELKSLENNYVQEHK